MKMRIFVIMVILILVANTYTLADRQLDRSEIENIFQTLTSQPRKTWIPAGTIRATHYEQNELAKTVIESSVTLRYDGDRFYWDINIDSIDSMSEIQGSHSLSRKDFDMNWNKRRTFVWDGKKYTMYFRPGNHAIVTESPINIPIAVNGPLTAGIIPWGYGLCSYKSLLAAKSSAVEKKVSGKTQINLTLQTTAQEMVFVLDPAKNYATLSSSVNRDGQLLAMTTFENHQLIGGKWIPRTITIEKYNQHTQPRQLLTYDHWNFDSINTNVPNPVFFKIAYETNTLVEYKASSADKPVLYYYSDQADTEFLLANKLAIISADIQPQNCASVAMEYAVNQLGKETNSTELASMIGDPTKLTSLDKLLQFTQQLNLYSACVKTDLASLSNLSNCQIILHLQNSEHYVIVSHIDNENVWVIDLTSNKFYYNIKQEDFNQLWGNGIALLVSNSPLNLQGNFSTLTAGQLQNIKGGVPDYSCSDLIQEYDVQFCSAMVGGLCGGVYRTWYNRYGCEEDENGGTCSGNAMVGNIKCYCVEDIYNIGSCDTTGNWYSQYIRACQ